MVSEMNLVLKGEAAVRTTPTCSKQRRRIRNVSKPSIPLPPQLARVNLNPAGIDIGAEEHWAAIPSGRDTVLGVKSFVDS